MRPLHRTAVVAIASLWVGVVLLVLAGRYTPLPMLPGAESGLVLGTGVGTAIGLWTVVRRGATD